MGVLVNENVFALSRGMVNVGLASCHARLINETMENCMDLSSVSSTNQSLSTQEKFHQTARRSRMVS